MLSTLLLVFQIPVAAWGYRAEMARSAYQVFGPGAPVATLAAQIHQESGWKGTARSWVGAQGLAQFMPATARAMARLYPQHCAPANPFSARWAFACRDRYLAALVTASRRPVGVGPVSRCSRYAFGLRAYNGGAGWMNRDRRRARNDGLNPDDWRAVRDINDGRGEAYHRENREYPERIYRLEPRYAAAGWGSGLRCTF
jgi:membrane-bound lytic murein transglycosylase MltF